MLKFFQSPKSIFCLQHFCGSRSIASQVHSRSLLLLQKRYKPDTMKGYVKGFDPKTTNSCFAVMEGKMVKVLKYAKGSGQNRKKLLGLPANDYAIVRDAEELQTTPSIQDEIRLLGTPAITNAEGSPNQALVAETRDEEGHKRMPPKRQAVIIKTVDQQTVSSIQNGIKLLGKPPSIYAVVTNADGSPSNGCPVPVTRDEEGRIRMSRKKQIIVFKTAEELEKTSSINDGIKLLGKPPSMYAIFTNADGSPTKPRLVPVTRDEKGRVRMSAKRKVVVIKTASVLSATKHYIGFEDAEVQKDI